MLELHFNAVSSRIGMWDVSFVSEFAVSAVLSTS